MNPYLNINIGNPPFLYFYNHQIEIWELWPEVEPVDPPIINFELVPNYEQTKNRSAVTDLKIFVDGIHIGTQRVQKLLEKNNGVFVWRTEIPQGSPIIKLTKEEYSWIWPFIAQNKELRAVKQAWIPAVHDNVFIQMFTTGPYHTFTWDNIGTNIAYGLYQEQPIFVVGSAEDHKRHLHATLFHNSRDAAVETFRWLRYLKLKNEIKGKNTLTEYSELEMEALINEIATGLDKAIIRLRQPKSDI